MSHLAIVHGARGRVGSAFLRRLERDGFCIIAVDVDAEPWEIAGPGSLDETFLFDCAYRHDDPTGHIERVVKHLANWRNRRAIFIPSSMWIGTDSPYGRAKLAIEQLAALYNSVGARIVTDRIGYFPGDDIAPDPTDPFIGELVTGDELYSRVMARMLA